MVEKKIKDSFNYAKLDQEAKERIYQKIMEEAKMDNDMKKVEASSDQDTIKIKSRIGRKHEMKRIVAACAALAITSGVTVGAYAGYKWMGTSNVAQELEDYKLAETFGKAQSEFEIQENDEYRVVNMGTVSGDKIGHSVFADDVEITNRTYVVVAIERKDKVAMELEDGDFFVSPLVQHLKPWQYNIFSQNGDASKFVKDGVMYILVGGDNIEMFAAGKVYLAVQKGTFYTTDAYNYDEASGEITRNTEFKDLNLLFDLKLDQSKADEKAAKDFIDNWNKENADDVEDDNTAKEEDTKGQDTISKIKSSVKDKENNLTLNIWDGTHFSAMWGDDEYSESYYSLYPEVIGEGIDSITYTLDNGTFYKKKEATEKEANKISDVKDSEYTDAIQKEYLDDKKLGDESKDWWLLKEAGSSYTVKYGEQNTVDTVYAIGVKAPFNKESKKEDPYKELALEMAKKTINVTINYKDGHTVNKKLSYTKPEQGIRSNKGVLEWQ